jgi:hypothetical protein
VTIQDLGAIGELVGAAGVVVTLAYLATQIRYARLAATDASRQGRTDGVREMLLVALNNRAYRDAWTKADTEGQARLSDLSGRLGLSQDEYSLVWYGCCSWAYIHWAQYRSMKSDDDRRELENLVSGFYSIPPMAPVWKHDPLLRALLDPGFVAWVDEVLGRDRASPAVEP